MAIKYLGFDPQRVPCGKLAQLCQLLQITWDGDCISKQDRDALIDDGYAARTNGFSIITEKGIKTLAELGIISH